VQQGEQLGIREDLTEGLNALLASTHRGEPFMNDCYALWFLHGRAGEYTDMPVEMQSPAVASAGSSEYIERSPMTIDRA
jgi:hypothetical protein